MMNCVRCVIGCGVCDDFGGVWLTVRVCECNGDRVMDKVFVMIVGVEDGNSFKKIERRSQGAKREK